MANLLDRAIRLKQKEHKTKMRLLHPKGQKAYILKRSGRDKKFVILAIFDTFGVDFSQFRSSEYFEFAVARDASITTNGVTRTMREIASISTHIATVETDGQSAVMAIRDGDDQPPFYFDWTWRYFTKQTSDTFDPETDA